jgi:drug/metabolite transporter superfamily protein YnfA
MAGQVGPNTVTDGLVLALDAANHQSYPGSGTNLNDISGNGIVATLINSPTVNSNSTITLDGVNQYIQVISDGTTKGFNTQNFTIDGWINMINDGAYNVLWSYDYVSHTSPFYAQEVQVVNGSYMQFVGNRASGTAFYALSGGITMLTYDNWYNFTLVRDTVNGRIYFYKNGVFITSLIDANTITYYNQEVWIGRANYTSGYFKGDIGPYKFYNRSLNASEVLQNYNATKGRFI